MTLDVIDLAKALMAEPSITPHAADTFNILQTHLEAMGFTVWREVFEEDGYDPTENLYARRGTAQPNLCFAGHVDVVPPGDLSEWTSPPFEPTIKDGMLYGRGAEDMKGAISAFVSAVSRFVSSCDQPTADAQDPDSVQSRSDSQNDAWQGSISLLLTADEEGVAINGTKKMLDWLAAKGEQIDGCIVGEPTNPDYLGEMVKVGRRGSLNGYLTVKGKQGHVAYPHLADNPLRKLVDTLNEMQHYALDKGTEFFPASSFQITTMDTDNPTTNLIPATATARFNIRFNDQHTGDSLIEWLHDVCDHWCGGREGYTLKCQVSGEAFLTRDERLTTSLVRAILDVTGHTPQLSTTGGTSDARFIKDVCPVIEFGTTGPTAHQVDECVKLETLTGLRDVYYHFLKAYLLA